MYMCLKCRLSLNVLFILHDTRWLLRLFEIVSSGRAGILLAVPDFAQCLIVVFIIFIATLTFLRTEIANFHRPMLSSLGLAAVALFWTLIMLLLYRLHTSALAREKITSWLSRGRSRRRTKRGRSILDCRHFTSLANYIHTLGSDGARSTMEKQIDRKFAANGVSVRTMPQFRLTFAHVRIMFAHERKHYSLFRAVVADGKGECEFDQSDDNLRRVKGQCGHK